MRVEKFKGLGAARERLSALPTQTSQYQSFEYLRLHSGGRLLSFLRFMRRFLGKRDVMLGWDGNGRALRNLRDLSTYVVSDCNGPILAAPLWICDVNDRCVLGSAEGFNSTDFLYANLPLCELQQAFDCLMEYLRKEGCSHLHFCFLHDSSITTQFLKQYSVSVLYRYVNTHINLDFDDYSSYVRTLGKHAAQNLRTAYNRIKRDGHVISFDFKVHPKHIPNEVTRLYAVRQAEHYRGQSRLKFRDWIRWCLFKDGFQIMTSPIGFLAMLKIDEKCAAFMGGMINPRCKMLEVPKLAIDIGYKFYSPGLLLMSEMVR